MESHSIAIHINGTKIVADVEPRVLLVHLLREQAGLTGTHIGCEASQCGAYTVRLGTRLREVLSSLREAQRLMVVNNLVRIYLQK